MFFNPFICDYYPDTIAQFAPVHVRGAIVVRAPTGLAVSTMEHSLLIDPGHRDLYRGRDVSTAPGHADFPPPHYLFGPRPCHLVPYKSLGSKPLELCRRKVFHPLVVPGYIREIQGRILKDLIPPQEYRQITGDLSLVTLEHRSWHQLTF